MQLFIFRNGQQTGPFSLDDVRAQLRSGMLQPTDLAWYEGAADWQPVSSIAEISGGRSRLAISREVPPFAGEAPPLVSAAAPAPQSKSKVLIGLLVSGLFALICLIATLFALMGGMQRGHTPVLLLILGIFGTMAGISFAAQMLGCLRQKGNADVCQCCNRRGPTTTVTLNRHIGAVLLMFHKSLRGALCKECVSKTFWEYTLMTACLGWWGVVSFFITPVVLTNNVIAYGRSLFGSRK